jgi:F0F1-type ATP synthase beta subunit
MATATKNIGKVIQIIGPVLDVEFEPEKPSGDL